MDDVGSLAALNAEVQELHFGVRPDQFKPAQVSEIAQWFVIDQIGVQAGYRRTGIGRALVQQVISAARTEGVREVELNSWTFKQEAHRAFANLGFVPKTTRFELRASAFEPKGTK